MRRSLLGAGPLGMPDGATRRLKYVRILGSQD
jgi:hypothetical protein